MPEIFIYTQAGKGCMSIKLLYGAAKDSVDAIRRNIMLALYAIILELSFIFLFGIFAIPIRDGIGKNLVYLGDEIASSSDIAGEATQGAILGSEYLQRIIMLAIVLAIIAYVLYSFFNGLIWNLCLRMAGKNQKTKNYLSRFFMANLIWFPLLAAYIVIDFLISYIETVGKRIEPDGSFIASKIVLIVLMVILYFIFISYIHLSEMSFWKSIKKSFGTGIKNALLLVPAFASIVLLFIIADFILSIAGRINFIAIMTSGIIILMPLMVWSRVFLCKVIEKL